MPVRIYALAKELKLDSKVLVDICPKAGVQGKGSALASLTDDEADKVRAYLSGGGPRASSPQATRAAPTPPSPGKLTSSRVPTLVSKTRPRAESADQDESTDGASAAATAEAEVEVETPEPQAPESPPLEVAAQGAPEPESPTTAPGPKAPPTPTRPDFSNAPMAGKLKTLSARAKSRADGGKKGSDSKAEGDGGPVIRVAKLPPSKQPPAAPKKNEPAPQKPDIKLPIDAIRKSGGALKDRVREIETRRREAEKQTPEKEGERETGAGRGRRGKVGAAPTTGDAEPMSREARKQKRQRSRAPSRGRGDEEREGGRRPRRMHTRSAAKASIRQNRARAMWSCNCPARSSRSARPWGYRSAKPSVFCW